jgi:hypothetical protein
MEAGLRMRLDEGRARRAGGGGVKEGSGIWPRIS